MNFVNKTFVLKAYYAKGSYNKCDACSQKFLLNEFVINYPERKEVK